MSYRLVQGIVKQIASGYYMIGDAKGYIAFIGVDKIIDKYPKQPEKWQTTIFKIVEDYEVQWKEERKYNEYAHTYIENTIPLPNNIPPDFLSVTPTTINTEIGIPLVRQTDKYGETAITPITINQDNSITQVLNLIAEGIHNQNKLLNTLIQLLSDNKKVGLIQPEF